MTIGKQIFESTFCWLFFFHLAEWLLADTAFAGHQLNIMEYDVRNNILSNHKLFIYMCPTPGKSDHFRFWLKTFRNVTFSAEWWTIYDKRLSHCTLATLTVDQNEIGQKIYKNIQILWLKLNIEPVTLCSCVHSIDNLWSSPSNFMLIWCIHNTTKLHYLDSYAITCHSLFKMNGRRPNVGRYRK